jgi:AraC family transcriptional activator of pobA
MILSTSLITKGEKIGKGLPYAIVPSSELLTNDHIYNPSLRDFHVIFWFKKGFGKYYIDFQEYEIKPNTVILLSKDQVNYFGNLDLKECEIQSIVFTPEYIYKNDSDLKHLFHFTVASHIEGVQILHLRKEEADALAMISGNMHMVYNDWKGTTRDNAFYHWLSLFLIHFERLQTHDTDCKNTPIDEHSKLILQFNQLLEKNYRTEFKVDFYLEEMGISVKALSKLTKGRYNLSPKAIIDERRVLEMKRLLKGTTIPSKNIAYDMGFDEPTNMTKYFKKQVGMTPNTFREEG